MGVQVNDDFSLQWAAGINLEDFDNGLQTMEDSLQQTIDKIVASANSSEDAVSSLIKAVGVHNTEVLQGTIDKLKELKEQQDTLKDLQAQTFDPTKAQEYQKSIEGVQGQIESIVNALQGQIQDAILDNLKQAQSDLDTSTQGAVTAMTRLRQIKNELASRDENDPGYKELLDEAAELQKRLKTVNDQTKLLGAENSGLAGMKSALRGVIGGFEALSGILSIVSDDNELVERTTRNVIAAMGILNGIEEISAAISKESALNQFLLSTFRKSSAVAATEQAVATEAVAVATATEAVATEGATAATIALNTAMAANPALLLVAGLAALVTIIELVASSSDDAAEKEKKMNEALAESNAVLEELARSYGSFYEEKSKEADQNVQLAQAEGKSQREINDLKKEALRTKRDELTYKLSSLGMDKSEIALKEAELQTILEQIQTYQVMLSVQGELSDEDQKRLGILESQKKAIEAILNPAKDLQKGIDDTNTSLKLVEAENKRKAHEDALKSDVAEAEARLLLVQKFGEEELKAQKDLIRQRTRAELDDVNLTAGERKKILAQEKTDLEEADRQYAIQQLNNQRALIKARLDVVKEGSTKELLLRMEDIDKAAEAEIIAAKGNAAKISEIRTGADKAKAELNKKFVIDTVASQVGTEVSILKDKLTKVEQFSDQELLIKRELLSAQAELDINNAYAQIKNEQQRAARIKEIYSQSYKERRDLDDAFVKHAADNNLKIIEQRTAIVNTPLEAVQQDPYADQRTKNAAAEEVLQNNKRKILQQILVVEDQILRTQGDKTDLVARQNDLNRQLLAIILLIGNQQKKTSIDLKTQVLSQLEKAKSILDQIANSFSGISDGVAETISGFSNLVGAIKSAKASMDAFNAAKAAQQAGTGSGIDTALAGAGAVASGIGVAAAAISVVSSVVNAFKAAKESREQAKKQIDEFKTQLLTGEIEVTQQYRERQREQVKLNALKLDGLKKEKQLLLEQRKETSNQYNDILKQLQQQSFVVAEVARGGKFLSKTRVAEISQTLAGKTFEELENLFVKGQLTGKAKELFEALRKLREEGAEIDKMLEENKKQAQEIFTGTTADAILDSIVSAFDNGLRSAEDFADNFHDLMKGALLNALKFQYLEGPLKQLFDEFAIAAESDGGLNTGEVADLQNMYNSIITEAGKKFDELQKIAGLNLSSGNQGNALSGAIKGMSEQTAELIAGQFAGLRINAGQQLEIANQALRVQQRIESNTAETVDQLKGVVTTLVYYYRDFGIKLRG